MNKNEWKTWKDQTTVDEEKKKSAPDKAPGLEGFTDEADW